MTPIKCFLLKPTDREARFLRRYHSSGDADPAAKCPASGLGCHNAMVRIEDGPNQDDPPPTPECGDPRWPAKCSCGYEFREGDSRQLFRLTLYADDANRLFTIHCSETPGIVRAPAGAMWFADWMPHTKGPEGRCLVVRCPASPDGSGVFDWMVDGPSVNGNGWTRTGEPPNVTARPSIFVRMPHGFHGWLTEGVLTSC